MDASERLIKAAKSGNIKEVKKLLSRGALFTKDGFGNTALHEAAWSGNNDIVKILLKAYCFVDSVNGAGFTPLHLASQNGHAKVAKTLLKWKASSVLKNQHEEAPIHLVAKYDHSHLVPVFAAAKIDLDIKAKDDNTALHIAAKLGNTATVKALIQSGANPNITNQKNKLPIDYAEFSKCQDAVKLLTPFTELSKEAKGRRSFFKARSSKSTRDIKTKPSNDGVNPPSSNFGIQMRQRSHTVSSANYNNSKRYSREFEDISSYLSSTTSGSGRTCVGRGSTSSFSSDASDLSRRSHRSKTRSPSLEELLEDVEKEAEGPNYRYPLPSSSDSDETSSVGCHSVHRMSGSSLSSPNNITNANYNFFKSPKLSPNHIHFTPSPLLKSPHQQNDQFKSRATKTVSLTDNEKRDDDYVCLRPASEITSRKALTEKGQLNSAPNLPNEFRNHTYEFLPPLPKKSDQKEPDGFDSYVEMAPRSDLHQISTTPLKMPPTSLNFTPAKQVPVIPDGTTNAVSPRSILKQTDSEKRNSQVEKYLQDELETIKHAFETRLSQMERKYKQQLVSASSPHSTSGPSLPLDTTFAQAQSRRASWHGKMRNSGSVGGKMSQLGEGFDSGSEESLSSSVADSSCCSSAFNTTSEDLHPELNNSKDGADADTDPLDSDMKLMIQEQVQGYKAKMMEMWMKEAEQQMANLEQAYLRKISGQQKLLHLQSTNGMDRSETFV